MDEALFLFSLLCGFILFCSVIYCFLSTCIGVQIRRSDIVEAFRLPTPASIRARDAERNRRAAALGMDAYELGEMDRAGMGHGYERAGAMAGAEEFEIMRRNGPTRGFFKLGADKRRAFMQPLAHTCYYI